MRDPTPLMPKMPHASEHHGDAGIQVMENYYCILKRGLVGIYRHVGKQHLKHYIYICEFDFRYNTRKTEDHERPSKALQGIYTNEHKNGLLHFCGRRQGRSRGAAYAASCR